MFMKIYIIPSLLISPLLTISCNSWFSIWMMMEFNLMSFIPMIIYYNKYFQELSFKYFIIQTISSSMMIISANSMMININKNFIWIQLIINLSLFMKLGMPPMHLWFINMMNNMNWINCLILSTWQKIIPMILLMYIYLKSINLIMIMYGTLLSASMGINHQSIRLIFSYSSINHMSWMLLNLMLSEMMWMFYFLSYLIINFSMMTILNMFNIYYINQFFILNIKSYNMILFFNLMSLSGMPPMFGFSMKWMTLYFSSLNNLQLLNLLMILMSMLTFIFYTRITISFLLMNKLNNKLILMNKFFFKKKLYLIFLTSFINLWIMSIWLF